MTQRTLLIVDDESHITYALAFKLKQAGFKVFTACDGEEGFRLACQEKPDLVVSDFQMPELSGYDMSVRLKETPETAAIPVLMLTARGHRLTPSELAKTNIQLIFPKPFSARELLAKVEEMLGPASAGAPAGASAAESSNTTGGNAA
ncbi:MAG: response regulator [Planctomycetota bacterium]|nr:response regulator [Planctomycetota bacterium]